MGRASLYFQLRWLCAASPAFPSTQAKRLGPSGTFLLSLCPTSPGSKDSVRLSEPFPVLSGEKGKESPGPVSPESEDGFGCREVRLEGAGPERGRPVLKG